MKSRKKDYWYRFSIAGAILVGVALGSWEEISIRYGAGSVDAGAFTSNHRNSPRLRGDTRTSRTNSNDPTISKDRPGRDSDYESEIETIYASPGLKFRPAYEGTDFVGYEVIASSSESRFSVGDVVIGVNGESLANLPVDGEYFMASIADKTAVLDIRNDKSE